MRDLSLTLLLMASLSFSLLGGYATVGHAQQRTSEHGFELASITFERDGHDPLNLIVEVARTSRERQQGLMGRKKLTDSSGMLFIWSDNGVRQFWMKDTPLSLDILFIDQEGIIAHSADAQEPFSEALISSLVPVQYVLELPAGDRKRFRLMIGDRLLPLKRSS